MYDIGFTNGCFDLLHEGHRYFLRECRKYCNRLVVGLNADASVRRLKGEGRPVWTERDRRWALMESGLADDVIPFLTEHHLRFAIGRTNPGVYFKGDEYRHKELPELPAHTHVMLIPMLPGFSTTREIERMKT